MNRNLMLAIVVIALAAVGFWLYGKSKREAALPDLAPVGANLIEGLGDYSMPVTAKSAGRAALVRPGPRDDLRLQPRRRRALVPEGGRTRPGLRDVLVGRGARARPARERGHGPGQQPEGLGPPAAGAARGIGGDGKGTGVHQGAVGALCREPAGGSPPARRGVRGRDGRAGGEVPGRPRRRDAARGVDDGPAALGLLGRGRPAEGPHGRGRLRRSSP